MKVLFLVQLLLHFLLATKACTEFRVTSEMDKSVAVGRSMEFMIDMESYVIVEPEGYQHVADVPEKCCQGVAMKWQNRYKVAYLDCWRYPFATDGLNDAGLSVGVLLFPGFSKYQKVPPQKCNNTVSHVEFSLWILGNFGSVQEVREALNSGASFPLVWERLLKGHLFESHYSVYDATGDGIVIEFTKEGRRVFNNTVGVMTNSPPYDFHMTNLRNYIQLSKFAHEPLVLGQTEFEPIGQGTGLLGVPGDFTPPSRLVRAACMANFADKVNTSTEAVMLAFHVLNTVDIPKGVAASHEHEGIADYSSWVVVKDLKSKSLYFRTYDDLTIRVIHLANVTSGEKLELKVDRPFGGFEDVTDQLNRPVANFRA